MEQDIKSDFHLWQKSSQLGKALFSKREMIPFLDLTILKEADETSEEIVELCQKATEFRAGCVCVYPHWVKTCQQQNDSLLIAAVGLNFPYQGSHLNLEMTQKALDDGAREIDMVINQKLLELKKFDNLLNEVSECQKLCNNSQAKLKVILEVSAFEGLNELFEVALKVCELDVDFIKTSTGKSAHGATLETSFAMLKAIKETGGKVGMKISGGVRTYEDALAYFHMTNDLLGRDFLSPATFRIGASSLLKDLMND